MRVMIQNSFIFLERIGKKKERNIWEQGIRDWESFISSDRVRSISRSAKRYYDRRLKDARRELFKGNGAYFYHAMPLSEQWRLYDFFREDAVYLDIETDGMGETDGVTVVGLFDGIDTKTMIRGVNLDFDVLRNELRRYKMIVTFNGSVFDVPFITKRYGAVFPKILHFDLRFCCKRIGLSGGLKEIERRLGIKRRSKVVESMCGGDAALLHRMWRGSGDEYYLNTLVEYNEEDTVNLKRMAEHVYDVMVRKFGFGK